MKLKHILYVLGILLPKLFSAQILSEEQIIINKIEEAEVFELFDAVAVDFNGDGYTDFVGVAGSTNEIILYLNNGAEDFTPQVLSDQVDIPRNLIIVDQDEDGDLDIICTSEGEERSYWLINNGSNAFTANPMFFIEAGNPAALTNGDIDGDGDMDYVYMGRNNNMVLWLEYDGSLGFDVHFLDNRKFRPRDVIITDVDFDNDQDIVVTYSGAGEFWIYVNDGAQNFDEFLLDDINTEGAWHVSAGDVDGDGIPDLIGSSSLDSNITVYYNTGGLNFIEEVVASGISARKTFLTDYDQNGTTEILGFGIQVNIGEQIVEDSYVISYQYESPENYTADTVLRNIGTAVTMNIANIDGDLDLDFYSHSYGFTFNVIKPGVFWHEINQGSQIASHPIVANGSRQPDRAFVADMDFDGDMDVIAKSQFLASSVGILENDGRNEFEYVHTQSVNSLLFDIDTTDFNNDGIVEVIVSNFTDSLISIFDYGFGIAQPEQTDFKLSSAPIFFIPVDLDSDGDVDILGSRYEDPLFKLYWAENDGNLNFTEHQIALNNELFWALEAKDFNEDGSVDIVCSAMENMLFLTNDGSETFTESIIPSSQDAGRHITVEDFNNDDHLDFITSGVNEDNLVLYSNDGSGNFTTSNIATGGIECESLKAVDVDADGNMDFLAAFDIDNAVVWFKGDNFGNFIADTISTDLVGARDFISGDLDSDTDLDLISVSITDNKIAWYENLEIDCGFTEFNLSEDTIVCPGGTEGIELFLDGSIPNLPYELIYKPFNSVHANAAGTGDSLFFTLGQLPPGKHTYRIRVTDGVCQSFLEDEVMFLFKIMNYPN